MINLDNLDQISRQDREQSLKVICQSAGQLKFQPNIINLPRRRPKIDNIVITGMGGSCLAGLMLKNWLDYSYSLNIPLEVTRTYQVPSYVSKNTLVICISVSGNTEETLSSCNDALAKHARVTVITSGGKLLDLANANNLPHIKLDRISQPRYGVPMHLRALTALLAAYKITSKDPFTKLEQIFNNVDGFAKNLAPDIPLDHNPAKQLALDCAGKTVLVYSSSLFYPLAYKWKTSFNENAKNTLWCNEFPEFNHNEFIGWTSHPIEKPFAVINLRSNLDGERINQRFDLTEKLLSGNRPAARNVILHGQSYIEQLLCGAIIGDITSIYLGLINGVDPTPVELVEKFKHELG